MTSIRLLVTVLDRAKNAHSLLPCVRSQNQWAHWFCLLFCVYWLWGCGEFHRNATTFFQNDPTDSRCDASIDVTERTWERKRRGLLSRRLLRRQTKLSK